MISAILLCAVFSAAQASYRIEPAPHGDLYVPEAADRLTPKVLAIHGGGWRTQDRVSFRGVAEALATRGAIVYNIDYRVPAQAPWPACGDDCLAAAEWLSGWRTNDFTETVFILGGTSGGHLSLMTGLRFDRRKVAGVISISGPADSGHDRGTPPDRFEQLLLKGLGDAEAARAFPTAYVSADLPDILLTHCYSDELVPVLSAKNFESKLRDVGAFVETYYYDFGRENEGHAIWVKGSNPPRLYPDIEDRVWRFITERFGRDALKVVGTVKAKSSREVSDISTVSVGFEGLDRHLFDPEPCYDKLAETGVKRARIQAGWSLCEPSKGVYDFSELDAVVSNLTVRGIEPWMMVGFGNTNWMGKCYTPAAVGCMPLYYGPECQAAWERFVAKLAARYAKKIRYWEIWNEPDIDSFWQPRNPSAADYAKLVKLTGGIIRRAVPDAKIGGVCSTVLNDWLREAVPLAAEGVDFWSIHAYGVVPERARGAQRDPNGREWDFVGQVASVRDLFVKAGRPNVEIWQAEAGFPSWFKANHWLLGQNREGLGCEEWQAKWLLRRFLSDRRAGCASSSFYAAADICRSYSMATTTQAHPAEHGLLDSRRGYVRKASHRAMSVYNATLAEATFVSSRKVGEVIVDEYVRDGRRLVAYYRADNLMENRPASTWDAGEAVLTPGGRLTDLLTGRIYARPKRLPLRDYPMLWSVAGGRLVPFRGGWFKAAAIYRAWARELPRTKAARARDRSRLRDISMWFWNRGFVKDALPPVERFRRDTGVGVAALPHGPEAGASAAAPVERRCERGVS